MYHVSIACFIHGEFQLPESYSRVRILMQRAMNDRESLIAFSRLLPVEEDSL